MTLETALVMPVLLVIVLLVVQATTMFAGQMFVHYAASAAVRTAMVQIPRDLGATPGLAADHWLASPGNEKFDAVERAAAMAMIPAAGRLEQDTVDSEAFAQALARMYEDQGYDTPRWVQTIAAARYAYALRHTTIQMYRTTVLADGSLDLDPLAQGVAYQFGPREPITVRVEHRLNLSVPYVNALFADGVHEGTTGQGVYAIVGAHLTLTNEGWPRELPPEPSLERRP